MSAATAGKRKGKDGRLGPRFDQEKTRKRGKMNFFFGKK